MPVTSASSTLSWTVKHYAVTTKICCRFTISPMRSRMLTTTSSQQAVKPLHAAPSRDQSAKRRNNTSLLDNQKVQSPAYESLTPAQRAARAATRARAVLQEQQQKYATGRELGSLADTSLFADSGAASLGGDDTTQAMILPELTQRSLQNMNFALNPMPDSRARWQRKMLVRHIQRRGRLPRQVQISRTERNHLSKSHFFKTSMKKLAPLARQIAGKSLDEAILQMRFSKKKAAKEVRAHLVQARDEAIVAKGMGLGDVNNPKSESQSKQVIDAGTAPPAPHQNPTKSTKSGHQVSPTNIYIDQAWVNRGPYGMEPEYRARGRVNILRPPWTGLSVLLKEEKTRTRQKADKELKLIRQRLGKNMWTQLPDRPIKRQSQHLLW